MRIVRLRNETGIDLIRDQLLPDDDYPSKEFMIREYKALFETDPENTFLGVAYNEETKTVVAFLLGYCEDFQDHAWAYQGWCAKGNSRVSDIIWGQFKEWSISKNRNSIRMQSTRSARAMKKRFGFEVSSTVFEFSLPKEPYNGQEQQTENKKQPEQRPAHARSPVSCRHS